MCDRCKRLLAERDALTDEVRALKLRIQILEVSLTAEQAKADKRFLSLVETAELLNVSRYVVLKAIKAGELKAYAFGKSFQVRYADLIEYQKKRLVSCGEVCEC